VCVWEREGGREGGRLRQTAEDKAMLKQMLANVAVDTLVSIKMLQQRVREVLHHMHLVS